MGKIQERIFLQHLSSCQVQEHTTQTKTILQLRRHGASDLVKDQRWLCLKRQRTSAQDNMRFLIKLWKDRSIPWVLSITNKRSMALFPRVQAPMFLLLQIARSNCLTLWDQSSKALWSTKKPQRHRDQAVTIQMQRLPNSTMATLNSVPDKEEDLSITRMPNFVHLLSHINKMRPISKRRCQSSRLEAASKGQTLQRTL